MKLGHNKDLNPNACEHMLGQEFIIFIKKKVSICLYSKIRFQKPSNREGVGWISYSQLSNGEYSEFFAIKPLMDINFSLSPQFFIIIFTINFNTSLFTFLSLFTYFLRLFLGEHPIIKKLKFTQKILISSTSF